MENAFFCPSAMTIGQSNPWSQILAINENQGLRDEPASQEVYKLFHCQRCNKSYKTSDSLRRHIRVECGQEPQHECPHCGRRFKYKFLLVGHMSHFVCTKKE